MLILKSGIRKANKNHVCDYCNGIIKKGEKYNYQNNKQDGDLYTWKSHEKCDYLATHLNMHEETYNDGLTSEDFKEHIKNAFDEHFKLGIKLKMWQKINMLYKII